MARWDAKIQAIPPLANRGDLDAQQELFDFRAQRAVAEEAIMKARSPADQVRYYTKALMGKQISPEAAEKVALGALQYLDAAQKEVRGCRHAVEKLTHELAAATTLSAMTKPQHLTLGSDDYRI